MAIRGLPSPAVELTALLDHLPAVELVVVVGALNVDLVAEKGVVLVNLHARSSGVIRGHQWSSEIIRGHQRSSEAIRGNQRSSEA